MTEATLRKFGVTQAQKIGEGGESTVYILPDGKMLRVYKNSSADKQGYLRMLKVFYSGLEGKFSFKTPTILEIGMEEGVLYSINELIPGRAMNDVLPSLNVAQKKLLYANYLDALGEVPGVVFPERPYGQIVGLEVVTAPTWTEFLERIIRRQAQENTKYFRDEFEDFPALVEKIVRYAHAQDPDPGKSLAHGDFFPNNILVNDELQITGLIDMSTLTVVGDHLLDVSSSCIFLQTTPGASVEDTEIYTPMVMERYGEKAKDAFDFYALYYSIYFGMLKDDPVYPKVYEWARQKLKDFQKRS